MWFGHVERMEKDRIAKRVYGRESDGSRSVGGRNGLIPERSA